MMQKVSDILQVDTNLNVVYDKLFKVPVSTSITILFM